MRLDHLLSKEHFSTDTHTGGMVNVWWQRPFMSSNVGLRELMGGTLTSFIAFDQSCVVGRGEYIGTLLGPERTRECFFLGK